MLCPNILEKLAIMFTPGLDYEDYSMARTIFWSSDPTYEEYVEMKKKIQGEVVIISREEFLNQKPELMEKYAVKESQETE